jgi:hypothetical protein
MGTGGGVFESMDAALDSLVESDKHGLAERLERTHYLVSSPYKTPSRESSI